MLRGGKRVALSPVPRCSSRSCPPRRLRRAAQCYAVAAFLAGRDAAVVVGAAVDGRGERLVLWLLRVEEDRRRERGENEKVEEENEEAFSGGQPKKSEHLLLVFRSFESFRAFFSSCCDQRHALGDQRKTEKARYALETALSSPHRGIGFDDRPGAPFFF